MTSEQRVAFITGCGKRNGIGAAIARLLAAKGVTVVVSDLQAAGVLNRGDADPDDAGWRGLETLVEEIVDAGGTASHIQGDVTSEPDVQRMVREAIGRHGRIDILVNNAGAPHGPDRADIEKVPLDAWERVMAINVRGAFLLCRETVGHMRERRWGRIVNIASAAGVYGSASMTAYAASKAALIGFTRALAMDVAPWQITANAICPGPTLTSRAHSTLRRLGFDNVEEGVKARGKAIPLGRLGMPEDIAEMVAFVASEGAGYLTAQAIVVDGGRGGAPKLVQPAEADT
jgi:NAD(P)-dependent dehydrogenase (short-subunit alcohol dehydrogenase family)